MLGLGSPPGRGRPIIRPCRLHWIVPYPAGRHHRLWRASSGKICPTIWAIVHHREPAVRATPSAPSGGQYRRPDGYTNACWSIPPTASMRRSTSAQLQLLREHGAVAVITRGRSVMEVNPKFPAKTSAEFIAYGKAIPQDQHGVSGNGTSCTCRAKCSAMTGDQYDPPCPYRGAGPRH